MSQPKRMTAKDRAGFLRVRGSTKHSSIPRYDLCVLIFGVLAVAQILRALMDEEALSFWQIAWLIVSIFLTLFFSYKAHSANDESNITQS